MRLWLADIGSRIRSELIELVQVALFRAKSESNVLMPGKRSAEFISRLHAFAKGTAYSMGTLDSLLHLAMEI